MGRFFGCDPSENLHVAVYASHDSVLVCWNFRVCPASLEGVLVTRVDGAGREHVLSAQPVQRFCFGDYAVSCNQPLLYVVSAVLGGESSPVRCEVRVPALGDPFSWSHAVFFNRGAAGSQRFSSLFGEGKSDSAEARTWLSKGLEEALVRLVDSARGKEWRVLVCAYELTLVPFLEALKRAAESGAHVRVVYDCKSSGKTVKDTTREAEAALEQTKFPREMLIQRTRPSSSISHNKFVVLCFEDRPVKVWTGSTNFTPGGVYGQLNAAHLISDPEVAKKFAEYWSLLSADPPANALRPQVEALTPLPTRLAPRQTVVLFSPRASSALLQTQAALLQSARESSFLTAAFGVNAMLQKVMATHPKAERFLLLESMQGMDASLLEMPHMKGRVAAGAVLGKEAAAVLELEAEELTGLNKHVKYVHTKLMLVDMFSACPVCVFGSGNFSEASVTKNDENQIIVRGDTDLADQLLVHLFRTFFHLRWRKDVEVAGTPEWNFMKKPKPANWHQKWFVAGSEKERQRNMMCPIVDAKIASLVVTDLEIDGQAIEIPAKVARTPNFKKEASPPASPTRVIRTVEGGSFEVSFPYNEKVVNDIKVSIPAEERKYDPARKVWTVVASGLTALTAFAQNNGFEFI